MSVEFNVDTTRREEDFTAARDGDVTVAGAPGTLRPPVLHLARPRQPQPDLLADVLGVVVELHHSPGRGETAASLRADNSTLENLQRFHILSRNMERRERF